MPVLVEKIHPTQIEGWALDDIEPARPLTIAVRLRGKLIGRAAAGRVLGNDGRRGFVVAVSELGDIVSALSEGGLSVQAERDPLAIGGPLLTINVNFARHLLNIDTLSSAQLLFGEVGLDLLLARIQQIANRRVGGAQLRSFCFDLLNYARAFFPAEERGPGFNRLGVELSKALGMAHAQRFYEARLEAAAPAPQAGPQPSFAPEVLGEDRFRTYGLPVDLVRYHTAPEIDFAVPVMITGHADSSFVGGAGIVRKPSGERPVVSAFGFRVNGFGGPDWLVRRGNADQFVAEKLYRTEFDELRRRLDAGQILVLDMSAEGPHCLPRFVEGLNAAFADLGVPASQVLLVNQNLAFPAHARTGGLRATASCAHYYIKRGVDLVSELYGTEERMLDYINTVLTRRAQSEQPKKYVCFNFKPRWPRWATVLSLFCNGHLDSGYVSFPGPDNRRLAASGAEAQSVPRIRNRERYLAALPDLLKRCPLTLDFDAGTWPAPDFAFPTALFENCFLHIVTETEMSNGAVRRVTEKILKPLVGIQPFLVVGNPGSLELMREMGFRTFGDVIDERYDAIADPAARFDALEDEMLRWLALDTGELRRLTASVADTLVYNFIHLVRVAPLLFGAAVEARLRVLLAAMAHEHAAQHAEQPL